MTWGSHRFCGGISEPMKPTQSWLIFGTCHQVVSKSLHGSVVDLRIQTWISPQRLILQKAYQSQLKVLLPNTSETSPSHQSGLLQTAKSLWRSLLSGRRDCSSELWARRVCHSYVGSFWYWFSVGFFMGKLAQILDATSWDFQLVTTVINSPSHLQP